MIKNVVTQIIFQTIYCTLGVIGVIASLGYFNAEFNGEFYVYYTNLSNYICLGLMFAILVQTIERAVKKEDGYVTTSPTFTFLTMILILVTFLVYNILLAGDKTASEYFLSMSNLLMHLILPIMFILHWVLFYEHGKAKWYYPLLSTVMPLIYLVLVFIRAGIFANSNLTLYPYFFLNVPKIGWGGVIGWICVLLALFILLGYIIYFFDNFKMFKEKFKKLKNKDSKQN